MNDARKAEEPRLLENMTVRDVREVLAETQTVLLPVGVVEQHGYHLPLSTDIHNAWQTALRVACDTGAVVAPTLPYSFSGGELPGTINVSPNVMCLMVSDILKGLAASGFRNLFVILGHAGSENLRALEEEVKLFLRSNAHLADVVVAFCPVWDFSPTWLDHFRKRDYHAALVETSLMLYWAGDLVRKDMVVDAPEVAESLRDDPDNYQHVERFLDDPHIVPRVSQRDDVLVGVMGDPKGADAELGERIAHEIVTGISRLVRDVEEKRAS